MVRMDTSFELPRNHNIGDTSESVKSEAYQHIIPGNGFLLDSI